MICLLFPPIFQRDHMRLLELIFVSKDLISKIFDPIDGPYIRKFIPVALLLHQVLNYTLLLSYNVGQRFINISIICLIYLPLI